MSENVKDDKRPVVVDEFGVRYVDSALLELASYRTQKFTDKD